MASCPNGLARIHGGNGHVLLSLRGGEALRVVLDRRQIAELDDVPGDIGDGSGVVPVECQGGRIRHPASDQLLTDIRSRSRVGLVAVHEPRFPRIHTADAGGLRGVSAPEGDISLLDTRVHVFNYLPLRESATDGLVHVQLEVGGTRDLGLYPIVAIVIGFTAPIADNRKALGRIDSRQRLVEGRVAWGSVVGGSALDGYTSREFDHVPLDRNAATGRPALEGQGGGIRNLTGDLTRSRLIFAEADPKHQKGFAGVYTGDGYGF